MLQAKFLSAKLERGFGWGEGGGLEIIALIGCIHAFFHFYSSFLIYS